MIHPFVCHTANQHVPSQIRTGHDMTTIPCPQATLHLRCTTPVRAGHHHRELFDARQHTAW